MLHQSLTKTFLKRRHSISIWRGPSLVVTSRSDAAGSHLFLSVFLVLLTLFLGVAAVSVLTATWWATGIAMLYPLLLPIQYHTIVRAKHESVVRAAFVFVTLLPTTLVVTFYSRNWTPTPLLPLAFAELLLAFLFASIMSAILCERFLKPRLASKT